LSKWTPAASWGYHFLNESAHSLSNLGGYCVVDHCAVFLGARQTETQTLGQTTHVQSVEEKHTPQENPVNDKDMLLSFEGQNIRGEYRTYFVAKRTNYFASIQAFPDLWDCFLRLDELWMREFSDIERISHSRQFLPLPLFVKSHAQFRLAFELGFSTCIPEAYTIARNAIDAAVIAAKLFREPMLGHVWLDKDKGKKEQKAFRREFEENKKESLFPKSHGLRELHEFYAAFSETGTHPTLSAMAMSYGYETNAQGVKWTHNYLEAEPKKLAMSLQYMLNAFALVEKAFYDCFDDRLKLDHELTKMRSEFAQKQKQCAQLIIKTFKIGRPPIFKP
jgi:hypothetical protein